MDDPCYAETNSEQEDKMTEQELNKIKADAVMGFVNNAIGAFESGFIDNNYCTLQQMHRSAQHHVKDSYGIDTQNMKDAWGDELFEECRKDKASDLEQAIKGAIGWIESTNSLRPEDGKETLRLLEAAVSA